MRTNRTVLGIGHLDWEASERISDRYGTIWLQDGDTPVRLAGESLAGCYGRLVARVIETRKSTHVGDWFRNVYPSTPAVGEVITLGCGQLFFTDPFTVGVRPQDEAYPWLDVEALYRAHAQTVELAFEDHTGAIEGPIPVPRSVFEGIEAVRRSGLTNMLDHPTVAEIAEHLGFGVSARWVREHRELYAQAIFRGFEVIEEEPS